MWTNETFFRVRIFPYPLWFTSRVWKVVGVPGLCQWVCLHIQTRRGRGFAGYNRINRCMLHAYPNAPNSNTFWDSQGIQVLIFPPLSSIHSFNLPQPIGDRQTGRGRRPNTVRNQQTSPKTAQRTLTQQNTVQDDTEQKQKEVVNK